MTKLFGGMKNTLIPSSNTNRQRDRQTDTYTYTYTYTHKKIHNNRTAEWMQCCKGGTHAISGDKKIKTYLFMTL